MRVVSFGLLLSACRQKNLRTIESDTGVSNYTERISKLEYV